MTVKELHQQYCVEQFDAQGLLCHFDIQCPENFNFSYDVVDAIASMEPERRALVWCNVEGEERIISYGELARKSNQAANLFASLGVRRGDKVMLILKRHYQFWYAILGLHKLGAVTIPATNLLTEKDLAYRFERASVSLIVASGHCDVAKYADEAIALGYDGIRGKLLVGGAPHEGWQDFDAELDKQSTALARCETRSTDEMLLYFTSGTTGMPKMVAHDFEYPIAHILTAKYWQNVDPDGLHLTVSETGWAKSVWGKLYGQFFLGSAVFVYDFDKFVPSELLSIIERHRITSFCAPPTIYRFFIKEGLESYNLSSLKYATIAGEALNPEVYSQFLAKTGLKLMEGFGQTETIVQLANIKGMQPKPGSMGKPTPLYHIALVDDHGKDVPNGEVGEIVIRTKGQHQRGMFMGYYRDQALTDSVWHDGLYHTGDTAWRDEDGYFWYVGRTDDLIKASGYRIGPFEIESVLIEHPAVLECAVTGAPDPVRGQVVKATIVLAKGYTASDALAKELQAHVKKTTAPYKYPRIVEFVTELPKTISGKIRRVEIRGEDKK